MNQLNNFTKGLVRENPLLVMALGICPALAVTTTAITGLGMGLVTTLVLCMSNIFISLVKNRIPDGVRMPAFIIIIASFVTMTDLLMQAYTPEMSQHLGIFIPLIVVNGMVLGRAEAFAARNNLFSSFIDALGMGIGFTLALTLLGGIREILATGFVFGHPLISGETDGILALVMAPGAFITLGFLIALWRNNHKKYEKEP